MLQAGDIGFHRDSGVVPWCIRHLEARKYPKDWGRKWPAHWNHVFAMTSPTTLIEANPAGVQESPLSKYVGAYQPTDTAFYRPVFPEADGAAVFVAAIRAQLNEKYDDLAIISDATYLLGHRVNARFGLDNHKTCSGTVAHGFELTGIEMGDYATCDSPADIFAIGVLKLHWPEEGV